MIYREEDIQRQLSIAEDSHWEFKQIKFSDNNSPKSPSRDDLADEIAAFANGKGGVLLCSVSDDGKVQSMSREQIVKLDFLLVEVATDSIKPPVRINTYHIKLSTDELILLVEIPKGDSQHDSPGGSFIRVGSSKRKMQSGERLRLAERRSQARYRWFDKQPLPNTGFATLEESLWKPLLSVESSADPKLALEKLALLASDDAGVSRATVAGVLLCTSSPERFLSSAYITATCYRGNDRTSGQIDAKEITGPLDEQIKEAVDFVVRNMRVSAQKTPARVEYPQYSEKALFEALVNAVAHRDYSIQGSKIRLSMFEDRVEIQSPGSLLNNLTIDSMAERQSTRNEALTSVLGRMRVKGIKGSESRSYFMERRGDGVPIIKRETKELSGKLPEYCLIDESEVRLTIPSASQEESAAQIVITTWSSGRPLPSVNLLVLLPNNTWKKATTDIDGEAVVDLHTTHLPMTVFAAALGYAAYVNQAWTPKNGALAVELHALPKGGSVIFEESVGYLPGLKGKLNAIRDTHGRTYLYASNLSINDGQQQPVYFLAGDNLRLTDSDGSKLLVRIVAIVGRSALLEYVAQTQLLEEVLTSREIFITEENEQAEISLILNLTYKLWQSLATIIEEQLKVRKEIREKRENWDQICSSSDVINDTICAIESYIKSDYPEDDVGLKYIFIYGLLQALFLQQNAVKDLFKVLRECYPQKKGFCYNQSDELKEIRRLRNEVTGHPTGTDDKTFNYISRNQLSKWYFSRLRSSNSKEEKRNQLLPVDLSTLLKKQVLNIESDLRSLERNLTF